MTVSSDQISPTHGASGAKDWRGVPRERMPRHVAVVMDGNGRWAKARHLPRTMGHQRGRRAVRRVIQSAIEAGIPYLTLFAFSSENWTRPAEEVSALMGLFLNALEREVDELHGHGVRLRFIGDRSRLPDAVAQRMGEAETRTSANSGLTLVIAISYGGQWDILQAATQLASAACVGAVDLDDEEAVAASFESFLATDGIPQVDLFIRTGGEQRISNFLLWQSAYAEIYFTDCLWPMFDEAAFATALHWFAGRNRRFGGLDE